MFNLFDRNGSAQRLFMKAIQRQCHKMLARIDENGVLKLTMGDIRRNVSFEEACVYDISGSVIPIYEARKVILSHEGRKKLLKNR